MPDWYICYTISRVHKSPWGMLSKIKLTSSQVSFPTNAPVFPDCSSLVLNHVCSLPYCLGINQTVYLNIDPVCQTECLKNNTQLQKSLKSHDWEDLHLLQVIYLEWQTKTSSKRVIKFTRVWSVGLSGL